MKDLKKHVKNGKKIVSQVSDAFCNFSNFASKKAKILNKIRHYNRNKVILEFFLIVLVTVLFVTVSFLKHKI